MISTQDGPLRRHRGQSYSEAQDTPGEEARAPGGAPPAGNREGQVLTAPTLAAQVLLVLLV